MPKALCAHAQRAGAEWHADTAWDYEDAPTPAERADACWEFHFQMSPWASRATPEEWDAYRTWFARGAMSSTPQVEPGEPPDDHAGDA